MTEFCILEKPILVWNAFNAAVHSVDTDISKTVIHLLCLKMTSNVLFTCWKVLISISL